MPDSGGSLGASSSVAIGTDGLPIVSYFDGSRLDLEVVHRGDARCL